MNIIVPARARVHVAHTLSYIKYIIGARTCAVRFTPAQRASMNVTTSAHIIPILSYIIVLRRSEVRFGFFLLNLAKRCENNLENDSCSTHKIYH